LGRKRLPEEERKEKVGLRLRKKVIEALLKQGTVQDILEKLAEDYVKKNKLID